MRVGARPFRQGRAEVLDQKGTDDPRHPGDRVQFGLPEEGVRIADRPVIMLERARIPPGVGRAMAETDIRNCGGTYGNPTDGLHAVRTENIPDMNDGSLSCVLCLQGRWQKDRIPYEIVGKGGDSTRMWTVTRWN